MIAYASAIDALRAANQVAGRTLYNWYNISPDGLPSLASNGIAVQCHYQVGALEHLDYLFVVASDEGVKFDQPRTLSWLRSLACANTILGGISGGAIVLTRAGVMTDHKLTLHWVYAAAFAEEFPAADLRRSLYIIDRKRLTCGGGVSPLDMMLAVIRESFGDDIAIGVSEWFLHTDIRDGRNPQRLSFEARLGVTHPGLIRVLQAMDRAHEDPLSRRQLAAVAGVSQRHLDRLFLEQVGVPLSAYYRDERLLHARQLVQQSSLSLLQIAIACGFTRASTFSKCYRRRFAVSPSQDRGSAHQRRLPREAPAAICA
jgi:transcriptional regulator GlxA family with amidase domain